MKNLKNKLILLILIIVLLLSLGFAGSKLFKAGDPAAGRENLTNTKKAEPVNTIPVAERPYTMLIPRQDGREVSMVVTKLSGYRELEYELEYQAGSLLQGAFGKIDFSKESEPVRRNLLLGSCSAGGKCSYHEDVNGGSLTLRYQGEDFIKLKEEWNFMRFVSTDSVLNSRDGKFIFDPGAKGLAPGTYIIVAQTMGLPGPVEGEIVGGPYAVFLPENLKLRTAEAQVSLRTSKDNSQVQLLVWDGREWLPVETEYQDKTVTGTVNSASVFVAVLPTASTE